MKRDHDITIVGAGIVGLTSALLLAQSAERDSLRITVVDAASRPQYHSGSDIGLRVSAISVGSVAMFERLGVWKSVVAAGACPYRQMRVWDAAGTVEGPETLRFDAAEFALPQLGFIVENLLLQDVLLAALVKTDVSIRFDTAIQSFERVGDKYQIEFGGAGSLSADLLVGADGAASFVRKSSGIEIQNRKYPQAAFVTHLRTELVHRDTAWQRFLETGPIALLPLSDGRVSTVWSTKPALAEHAMHASHEELSATLSEASDYVLGRLSVAGPRASFPLQALSAKRYTMPGLALVGDAAHAIHPLAGQGANLGLADARTLATVVSEAIVNNEYPGDLATLRRYERARKGANLSMLHMTDGLNRLFSNDSAALARLRGSGMRLFNKSGPIRARAVQIALGLN